MADLYKRRFKGSWIVIDPSKVETICNELSWFNLKELFNNTCKQESVLNCETEVKVCQVPFP